MRRDIRRRVPGSRMSPRGLAAAAVLGMLALGSGPAIGAEVQVVVQNFTFTPAEVVIDPGDTVRWTNQEGFHNVSADDGSFRSGEVSAGWVFVLPFEEAGDFPYYCEAHGGQGGVGMSGVVTVRTVLIFADGFETGNTDAWSDTVGGL